ncbi:MAG: hypothetical protein KJP12_00240, partial [Acidimicrobiia bacterium]|nr:hypothetical protein [Acidimicrobiia bacterium]
VNLDAYVLDTDFLDPTGVVWTGDEFIVVTEGTSLGVSGVLLSSPDGVSWSRTTLEVDVLDTAATRGNRAATLLWTPELIQSAGNVGLASIDMAGDVIVIGGWARLGTEPTPLIWTSSDGDAWAVRELPGTREIVRSIDAGPGAIAAFGLGQGPGGGLYDIMWVSENLAQWERYEYDIQDLEFVVKTAFGTNGHLIQATTYTSEGPRWWHSPDGSAWSPVDLPFDIITTWHDRWVGVTCEGGGASISVSADHVTWTESGTIGRCPDRVVHDGDEPVFIDTEGTMWRRITDRWTTDDMVSAGARDTAAVVLVRHDDVLNVRTGAGVDNPVIGALDPQTRGVPLTGPTTAVGSSRWVEIDTPMGAGWVNSYYLITEVPDNEYLADAAVDDLIDALASAFVFGDGLEDITSSRGLVIDYFGFRHRFSPAEVADLTRSTATRKWGSNAADISEVPERTFTEAVGDPFIGIYTDDDRQVAYDQVIPGGNGNLPEFIVPDDLKAAHFVAFKDPGDNPDFGGLDWYAWYVYVVYEDGEPKVLAMSNDAWAP